MENEIKFKSPVTALQEFLEKKNKPFPDFKFTYNPLLHQYECEFEFNESTWRGNGNSKKNAKQSAALALIKEKFPSLLKLIDMNYLSIRVKMYCRVNHLRSICKKMHIKLPVYRCWRKGGPEHKRVYVSECFLPDIKYKLTAEALSKKDAKQMVAEKMAEILLSLTNHPLQSDEIETDVYDYRNFR